MNAPECRQLTPEELEEQHPLYIAAQSFEARSNLDLGRLLYCRTHRRPVIECHDAIHSKEARL